MDKTLLKFLSAFTFPIIALIIALLKSFFEEGGSTIAINGFVFTGFWADFFGALLFIATLLGVMLMVMMVHFSIKED